MREAPPDVSAAELLALVRAQWDPRATRLEHLPVGFGAHHWVAFHGGTPTLFVTLDALAPRHTPGPSGSLEAAYAAAAALRADGLEFVLAPLPGRDGRFTVPLAGRAVSVTAWCEVSRLAGHPPETGPTPSEDARRLARLHAAAPPPGIPRWRPLVPADLPERLAVATARPWDSGPYGERARRSIRVRLDCVQAWTRVYRAHAERTDPSTWVPTHGEPHRGNQLSTRAGVVLVDWESLRLAPRERDLGVLVDSGPTWRAAYDLVEPSWQPHWPTLEMFDLEWRLDEITQYAAWFAAPHTGTPDDRVALGGLMDELTRPEPRTSLDETVTR